MEAEFDLPGVWDGLKSLPCQGFDASNIIGVRDLVEGDDGLLRGARGVVVDLAASSALNLGALVKLPVSSSDVATDLIRNVDVRAAWNVGGAVGQVHSRKYKKQPEQTPRGHVGPNV